MIATVSLLLLDFTVDDNDRCFSCDLIVVVVGLIEVELLALLVLLVFVSTDRSRATAREAEGSSLISSSDSFFRMKSVPLFPRVSLSFDDR